MSAYEKDPEQLLVDILTSEQLDIIDKWTERAVAAALDEKWKLLDKQVEYLRQISSRVPGVLDLKLSLDSSANTLELLKDMLQHERTRADAAVAALAAVPRKAIYDCWYHSDGQTPDDSTDAVEKWLEATRTAIEPDWTKAPGLAKWWAVDEDGTAHWYWAEPTMGKHGWFIKGTNPYLVATSQLAGHIELVDYDWWDTLRQKPGSTV